MFTPALAPVNDTDIELAFVPYVALALVGTGGTLKNSE
jgi:hypothetical protein